MKSESATAAMSPWKIWDKDDAAEYRTYLRATGELPEMESTKQLVDLLRPLYRPGMRVLDVGCAAGHYYRGLRRLDEHLDYTGIDATRKYIDFAQKMFKDHPKARFLQGDIFDLPADLEPFDVVFCCNVLLHLPDFRVPIRNLLQKTGRSCFIRTLIGDRTLLVKNLVTDTFDDDDEPTHFVYQNIYSFDLLSRFIHEQGTYEVELIEDRFDPNPIKREYDAFKPIQQHATRIVEGRQVSGSLIFEWNWLKITRR